MSSLKEGMAALRRLREKRDAAAAVKSGDCNRSSPNRSTCSSTSGHDNDSGSRDTTSGLRSNDSRTSTSVPTMSLRQGMAAVKLLREKREADAIKSGDRRNHTSEPVLVEDENVWEFSRGCPPVKSVSVTEEDDKFFNTQKAGKDCIGFVPHGSALKTSCGSCKKTKQICSNKMSINVESMVCFIYDTYCKSVLSN
jgi:hypothetical protein